jgi:hypothetical protein
MRFLILPLILRLIIIEFWSNDDFKNYIIYTFFVHLYTTKFQIKWFTIKFVDPMINLKRNVKL